MIQTKPTMWSPFQSKMVREICAHMTPGEESVAVWRGGLYGVWTAVALAIPLPNLLFREISTVSVLWGGLILLYLCSLPQWMKIQRAFLCSTSWAQEQGITPQNLQLFSFRKVKVLPASAATDDT